MIKTDDIACHDLRSVDQAFKTAAIAIGRVLGRKVTWCRHDWHPAQNPDKDLDHFEIEEENGQIK